MKDEAAKRRAILRTYGNALEVLEAVRLAYANGKATEVEFANAASTMYAARRAAEKNTAERKAAREAASKE